MGLISKVIVEIDGEEVRNFVELKLSQSIYTHHEFEVSYRREKLEDPDAFPMEKSSRYIGADIKIGIEAFTSQLKSASQVFFFKGIITEVRSSKSGMAQHDYVYFRGHSPDILLQDNPGSNSFNDQNIKQIVEKVLAPYPKDMLRSKVSPNATGQIPYTVQYNESRYDFIRRLARRYGEWFFYDGMELHFGPPVGKSIALNLGGDLNDFGFSISLNPINLKYVTYNQQTAGPVETASTKSSGAAHLNPYGSTAHQKSMRLFNQTATRLYDHLNTDPGNYPAESASVVDLTSGGLALDMSVASGKSLNPELKVGGKVEIQAHRKLESGKTDFGEYIITSISHYCDNLNNYRNEFTCIPAKAKVPDYTDPMAYPVCEPQYAIVTANDDPDKLGRVKVKFFWQTGGMESPWIRVAHSHAGSDRGFYFIPEIDEEVMVGFESGDAERPYVMGSLYNGKLKPAGSWGSGGNDFKAIRTRSGNTIELIDKKGEEEIIIYQENNKSGAHHISLSAGSDPTLKIFSKGKMVIEAKSIEIKSTAGSINIASSDQVTMKSQADTKVEGMNLSLESKMNSELKAGMNAKVEAGMMLENKAGVSATVDGGTLTAVKGALVTIN